MTRGMVFWPAGKGKKSQSLDNSKTSATVSLMNKGIVPSSIGINDVPKRKNISGGDLGRAARLRLARQAQGFAQQDIGWQMKVVASTIGSYEVEGFVKIETGEALARALGVAAAWLFWGDGESGNAKVDEALGHAKLVIPALVAGAVLGEPVVEGAKVSGSAHTHSLCAGVEELDVLPPDEGYVGSEKVS